MNNLTLYDKLQVLDPEERVMGELERLAAMERPLLSWYDAHARVLPWRENPEAYRVWISEIMLQQTRVEAVKPYFERFMAALPDISALAEAEEDVLLKLWEGLGYYNRARNLKKAAVAVVERYDGRLPSSYEELLQLAGIGSYTAGAISSIAFGKPYPAVDGNVLRVISRVTGSREDILKQASKKRIELLLGQVMPKDHASSYNQGLIEIGAMVCVPNGTPLCDHCPLSSVCIAKRDGLTEEIPVKTPKKARRIEEKTVFLLTCEGRYAIRKRLDTGLLASMYEFPNIGGRTDRLWVAEYFGIPETEVELLLKAKHIFTHVEWHMMGYRVSLPEGTEGDFIWVTPKEIKEIYSLPNAFQAYTKLIR